MVRPVGMSGGCGWRPLLLVVRSGSVVPWIKSVLVLLVVEDKWKILVSAAPFCCFNQSRNFCDFLVEMVDGGCRWLADDFAKRYGVYLGSDCLVNSCVRYQCQRDSSILLRFHF